jgi:hypothetical protein
MITNYELTSWLTSLPSALLMSRHELSLFNWSFASPSHVALIITGDMLAANPKLPAPWGAAGAVLLGVGLVGAGVEPSVGYILSASAWCLSAACHFAVGPKGLGAKVALQNKAALAESKHAQMAASKATMQIRVGGWDRPIYWAVDDCLRWVFYAWLLQIKPSWTVMAAELLLDSSRWLLGVISFSLQTLLFGVYY